MEDRCMKHRHRTWRPKIREPAFTAQEKRDAVKLLIKAKPRLARTKSEHVAGKTALVCMALADACDTQADHDIEPKVRKLIWVRLDGAATLRHWLAGRGYPVFVNDQSTFIKVQLTRLRWVDGLIQELTPPVKEKRHERTRSRKNVPDKKRKKKPDYWL
jgi:hypothetical protein